MRVLKKMLTVTGYLVVAMSFMSGFAVGAIFGETVINKTPTVLTFYLAELAE